MGEAGGGEEKARPDTKLFSKSCDTYEIWMWQWLDKHNTAWRHRPQVNTSRAIGKEKPLNFFIDVLISCYVMYFYGQRRREEFKKALEGALKFFNGIKIKPEQELCFQGLVVQRKDVLGVWKSIIYQRFCRNYVWVLVSQDRDKEDDISVSDI